MTSLQSGKHAYSHADEDAILTRIFASLGTECGYFVEFGAWDGRRLSNTRVLREKGWAGLLIEGDRDKFLQLQQSVTEKAVALLHCMVQPTGENRLDAILRRAGSPRELDLLSIDIDSDDLAVWMSLTEFQARCVVIEFNVTIPFDVDFVNPRGKNWGNAPLTIWKFAKARGYTLVAITGMNLIFLQNDLAVRTGMQEISLHTRGLPAMPRYFWGYDGTLLSSGSANDPEILMVPFHRFRFAQPLPKFLRRWHLGKEANRTEMAVSWLTLWFSRPAMMLRRMGKRKK